jgi:hypothetical protein
VVGRRSPGYWHANGLDHLVRPRVAGAVAADMTDPAGAAQYLRQFPVPRDDLGLPSDQELQATLPCGGHAPAGPCLQDLHAAV